MGGAPLNSLSILKLAPGVTQADLDTFGVCFTGDNPPDPLLNKDCFEPGGMDLGGNVSAGASVFWYYRLAPGDYVAGNVGRTQYFDTPLFSFGWNVRFTVS